MTITRDETRVGNVLAGWNHLDSVGPIEIQDARGPRIQLPSGEWRDDYIMGWGSCFLGHDAPVIREAIANALSGGFLQQYETAEHQRLSEQFCSMVPCAERLRLVNSGLEATMYATRIARAATGRRRIIKFEGHFHGLNDTLTWNLDSSPKSGVRSDDGELELVAGTVGIPEELGQLTVPVSWNDIVAVRNAFEAYPEDIAAIIVEPVALNIGCVKPDDGFLRELRELTTKSSAVLIFDEVLTGFRTNVGGAQSDYGVTPDVATYGKAFGCGIPIAGIAGKAEYMDVIAPSGPVQISGTNTGRYLSVSAALAVLEYLSESSVYEPTAQMAQQLENGLREVFARHDIPCYVDGYGGRIGVHIGSAERPRTMREIEKTYPVEFAQKLFHLLSTEYGLYGFLLPLGYCPEPVTISTVHTPAMIDNACTKLDSALSRIDYRDLR